jgi:hypothetical protein
LRIYRLIHERVYIYGLVKRDEKYFIEYGYDPDKCPGGIIAGSVEITDCTGVKGDYEIHLTGLVRFLLF